MTIEVALGVGDEPWSADGEHDFAIAADYLSGGPARRLAGDFRTEVRAVRSHTADELDGFVFGPVHDPDYRFTTEVQEFTLDDAGRFEASVSLDAAGNIPPGMYELRILAAVRDVGGRPNTATATVPLATLPSYVGVRSEFGERLRDGATAAFSVVRIDRLGARLPDVELPYRIVRVRHSYDWYYDEGWRWRRTRQADETVASGTVGGGKIIVSSPLDWGSYELMAEDVSGSRTVLPFRVGWGSDGRPALEPEQLALSVAAVGDAGMLRASLPFAGILRVQIADADVVSDEVVRVSGGDVEIPLVLPDHLEPGYHVLATLLRPVRTGSEHLPQVALGSAWISSLAPERDVGLRVDAPNTVRSTDPISVTVETQAQTGSAVLYLVDEGIHALTGFRNEDPKGFFYGERELPLGFVSNYGRMIRQDHALPTFRAGGDEDAGSRVALKSKFFKTVAVASPILPISNGRIFHEFDQADFEGRLRLVVLVASDRGLGFREHPIEVRDPVSLDVSLPRFIGTGDELATRLGLRANETAAHVRLEQRVGERVSETRYAIAEGNNVHDVIALAAPVAGVVPVEFTASFDAMRVSRTFALRARPPSYPHTELRSLSLSPATWLRAGRTDAPALTLPAFDLAGQTDLEYRVTVSATPGVALDQIFAALDRYPYGCLEQVASATRGLIFRQQLRPDRSAPAFDRERINQGIARIIAKQKSSGAFGYWDRSGRVWDRFQPYAVETLMLALPRAEDRSTVTGAIENGLAYLYRRRTSDVESKLYAYGVLARAGYEVTSRARYAIDHELATGLRESDRDVLRKIDRVSLAYWLADILDDQRRMTRLHGALEELLADRPPMDKVLQRRSGWAESGALFAVDARHVRFAAQSAHFLAQVSAANRTPLIAALVQETGAYLSALPYRSTYLNSRLAQMVLANTDSLADANIEIDGQNYRVTQDGSVDLAPRLLRSGFELSHELRQPLYLNVEVTGPRATRSPVDRGFKIEKTWYDSAGKRIEIEATPLHAEQGDLFTVVLEIVPTRTGLAGESVLTDLLPSGFELEAGAVAAPYTARGDVAEPIDLNAGKRPEFVQRMDDRFVAHFAGRWARNERSVVAYTVRAVYPGTMVIPDAHLELLYQPHVNGRSMVRRAQIVIDPSGADHGVDGCADEPCAPIVARFMKIFSNGDKAELAASIVFPIPRPYPIPAIERSEFPDRYHEVFDETLTRAILGSTLSDWVPVFQTNHRSTTEWLDSSFSQDSGLVLARSIQLGSDQGTLLKLEYSGKVSFVYYQSEFEKEEVDRLLKLRDTLIHEDRRGLHTKLHEFESPVLEWETNTYRIRVDHLGSDTYRYSAWKIYAPRSDRPDLVLDNGRIIGHHDTALCGPECGAGEGAVYGFTNQEYLYEVDAGHCYCYGPPEERRFNLRVWRSPGRVATVPALASGHGFFFPGENGYELVLHEPFEDTSNRIDLELYADYRARSAAIRGQ